MSIVPRLLSALPGLLLAAALALLLTSPLLRYAEALLWLPHALRSVNLGVIHQSATDLLIAMTLLGAAHAARVNLPRPLILAGLIFSLFMTAAGAWYVFESFRQTSAVRIIFYMLPLASLLMATNLSIQLRSAGNSPAAYFPVNMADGGIKVGLLLGASAFVWATIAPGGDWKALAQRYFDSLDQYTLMAIPFLVLAGVVLNPRHRSGNLAPFVLLALWFSATAGVGPGKFIFALIIPGAMVAIALQLSGARNIVFAEHNPVVRLLLYGVVFGLFVGSMMLAFVTFTEGAALAALAVCIAGVFAFNNTDAKALPQIFSYAAVQSAGWLFTGATAMLAVRVLGDMASPDLGWLSAVAEKITMFEIAPALLLVISLPVAIACYFIGPIAAMLLASALYLPFAAAAGIEPLQIGVVILISLAMVKVWQTNRPGVEIYYPHFNRRQALFLLGLVLMLVAFFPKLSLRLPLLTFGPGS